MPNARIVTAYGATDGVNVKFYAGVPYVPGSTVYILNGRTHRPDYDDGHVESNPGTGEITVNEAPLDGDVVQLFFTDTAPTAVSPLQTMSATLKSTPEKLTGTLHPVKPATINGAISATHKIKGTLRVPAPEKLSASVKGGRIVARLKEVC